MLRMIGYWTDTRLNRFKSIHPKCLVDPDWEVGRRQKIIQYVRSGIDVRGDLGCSYCRFENGPSDYEMGCTTLCDGAYVWPVGLAIYVERYQVRLPDEFIDHMAERDFLVLAGLDRDAIKRIYRSEPKDMTFWVKWCKKQKRRILFKKIQNLDFSRDD